MKTSSAVTADHRSLEDNRIYKLVLASLFATLSYVVSTFLQTKTTFPEGDTVSIHLGNTVCVLGVLILGSLYGGLGEALGMTAGDLLNLIYVACVPKTSLLKFCISLITGLMARKTGRINESSDKGHVLRFVVAVSVCGLLFNMIFDPLAGYYYKLAILGKPAMELVLAWNIAFTSINAVMPAVVAMVIYMPLRSTFIRARFFDRFR